jgi:hypothetical protein
MEIQKMKARIMNSRCQRILPIAVVLIAGTAVGLAAADDRMTIHEWGTFTALQDADGRQLGGINIDDEPVPEFVHNLRRDLLRRPQALHQYDMKGAPMRHPHITLRLETPVLYFYPPEGAKTPTMMDVRVDFRGGWLTEFYPFAAPRAEGLQPQGRFGALRPSTMSALNWTNLKVGTAGQVPETDSHVWLAPRKPKSATVTAENGESEQYLFYRGVGNFDAPLSVLSDEAQNRFRLRSNFGNTLAAYKKISLGPLWLVDIRQGGRCAYRTIDSIQVSSDKYDDLFAGRRDFDQQDFAVSNLDRLCDDMHRALVTDGLYADEATAMLDTWKRAYFKSPGLRLFFLVPRAWTDYYLPLTLSRPADVERVMVARIELISQEQRALLDKLRKSPPPDLTWLNKVFESKHADRFFQDRTDFTGLSQELGIEIPQSYQNYLALGRFRNALVIAEEKRNPSENLSRFIDSYGLESYRVPDDGQGDR